MSVKLRATMSEEGRAVRQLDGAESVMRVLLAGTIAVAMLDAYAVPLRFRHDDLSLGFIGLLGGVSFLLSAGGVVAALYGLHRLAAWFHALAEDEVEARRQSDDRPRRQRDQCDGCPHPPRKYGGSPFGDFLADPVEQLLAVRRKSLRQSKRRQVQHAAREGQRRHEQPLLSPEYYDEGQNEHAEQHREEYTTDANQDVRAEIGSVVIKDHPAGAGNPSELPSSLPIAGTYATEQHGPRANAASHAPQHMSPFVDGCHAPQRSEHQQTSCKDQQTASTPSAAVFAFAIEFGAFALAVAIASRLLLIVLARI